MEEERREERRLRIILGVELATDELFGLCGGVCPNYSIVPYEIIVLQYYCSRILLRSPARLVNGLVISVIGVWASPISYSVPLLNGSEQLLLG